jgi:hypothetical protein
MYLKPVSSRNRNLPIPHTAHLGMTGEERTAPNWRINGLVYGGVCHEVTPQVQVERCDALRIIRSRDAEYPFFSWVSAFKGGTG